MLARALLLFSAVASHVAAYPEFSSPSAGATLTGGTTITMEWKDSGDSPSISDLSTYQLFLCAGSNDVSLDLTPLVTAGQFSTGNTAAGLVQLTLGADTKNAYFLKMIATATAGGTVTVFSSRFTLSGMTGSFPDNIVTALKSVTGTDGPAVQNSVANGQNANPSGDSAYNVAYSLQTGLTKYAPMQPVPPTKITKKNASPLFPTSAVTIATTFLAIPKQQTTITQSQTFSVSSMENTQPAAAQPSDDMAKFLARWKD